MGVSCPEPRWVPGFSPQPPLLLLLSSHWLNVPFFCSLATASRSSAARCIFAVRASSFKPVPRLFSRRSYYLHFFFSSPSLSYISMLQVGRTGRMGEQAAGDVLFHLQGRRRAEPWLLRLQHKVCYLHE